MTISRVFLEHTHSDSSSEGVTSIEADLEFRRFVQNGSFPCLGAKSAVRLDTYSLEVYESFADSTETVRFARHLAGFCTKTNTGDRGFRCFVAVFPNSRIDDELAFEQQLWRQLQLLHELDPTGAPWAHHTSSDPTDPHFSFSFAGEGFFVVGLHPSSSRFARRFRWPALVFNPHSQFTRLREEGRFEGLRNAIRHRDIALQGTPNPNAADFGEQSEARQYSGRRVEADWKCPFHHKPN